MSDPGTWPDALRQSEPLTQRERMVLGLLAEGLTAVAIASKLAVPQHVVEADLEDILLKLHVRSLTAAAIRAIKSPEILDEL